MAGKQQYNQVCPIATMLDVVGNRWALLVVRELNLGPRRFKDIHAGLETASTDMLTSRLRELEAAGLIESTDDRRYQLTAVGRALSPVIRQMMIWTFRTSSITQDPTGPEKSFGPDPVRRLVGLMALLLHTTPQEPTTGVIALSVGSLDVVVQPGRIGYEVSEGSVEDPDGTIRLTDEGLFSFLLAGLPASSLVDSSDLHLTGAVAERVMADIEAAVAGAHTEIQAELV